jgi:protein SCO1/2
MIAVFALSGGLASARRARAEKPRNTPSVLALAAPNPDVALSAAAAVRRPGSAQVNAGADPVRRPGSAQANAGADPATPVGVDEHPGARVPAGLTFRDRDGSRVTLQQLLDPKVPTVLVLAYFRCPMLCDQIIGSLAASMPAMRTSTGIDYRALVVSFDPRDTPQDAGAKADALVGSMSTFERAHWHFVVDDHGSSARLAAAVGFKYRFDTATGMYAHPAVAMALSPDGRISRYLYGVSFPPELLAPALRDAANGHATGSLERILLTCALALPSLRAHAGAVRWVLRGGTSLAFLGLAASLVVLVRRQRPAAARRARDLEEPRDA